MLTIDKVVLPSPEQWEIVLEGMRNPMNSWDRMDSYITYIEDPDTLQTASFEFFMGDNDEKLANSLVEGGSVHAKFRRMLPVWVTITAPLYFWNDFDTYKIGTVSNGCSTMHKIHAKEFTLDDFSHEHLIDENDPELMIGDVVPFINLEATIMALNFYRNKFLEAKNKPMKEEAKRRPLMKKYWWQMIQLLHNSYNQKRTIFMNYETLANIYEWRHNHKLDEFHVLCDWIETLPYSELITGTEEIHNA